VTDRERRLAMRKKAIPTAENDAFAHAGAMVLFPLVLGFLGVVIDHALGTKWVFTALLATLGVIGSFASAYYRYEARMAQHDEGKPWTRRAQQAAQRDGDAR
jgi:positive regulator of sigma E activity